MEVLWAPWRMEYVSSDNEKGGCIFCPCDDRSQDEKRLILYRGNRSIVLMNRFPYINGHLLVAPLRHVSTLDTLLPEEKLDLITMVEKSIGVLKGIIVPRWSGDTNYMTVCGEVRVIPEHIQATYQKLVHFFK